MSGLKTDLDTQSDRADDTGFSPTPTIPKSNVQDAIQYVYAQIAVQIAAIPPSGGGADDVQIKLIAEVYGS